MNKHQQANVAWKSNYLLCCLCVFICACVSLTAIPSWARTQSELTALNEHKQQETSQQEAPSKASPKQAKLIKNADGSSTYVGFNRTIKKEDFAGFSKTVILQMQKELDEIYSNLDEWKNDYALKGKPLNDGIVGPITLKWLQRFALNFKLIDEADYAKKMPNNIARVAAFGRLYPSELKTLLGAEFEIWNSQEAQPQREQDYQVRRAGNNADLLALLKRFALSKSSNPEKKLAPKQPVKNKPKDDGYVYYVLAKDDYAFLENKDRIVTALEGLKEKEFNSLEQLKVELSKLLENEINLKKIWKNLSESILETATYRIDNDSLELLKKQGASTAEIDALDALSTVEYQGLSLFEDEVKASFKKLKIDYAKNRDSILLTTQLPFHIKDDNVLSVQNFLKIDGADLSVSKPVVTLLSELENVSYPELSLFSSAVQSKVYYGFGVCQHNNDVDNGYLKTIRLQDDDLALVKKELQIARPELLNELSTRFLQIEELRHTRTVCSESEKTSARQHIQWIYQQYWASLVESAARTYYPNEIKAVQLAKSDCACTLDLGGIIYGFYPHWEKSDKPVQLDFSALHRTAYQALWVDNLGNLSLGNQHFNPLNGSLESNQFIQMAHQFNSKADWLIQKNDWSDWRSSSREKRQMILERLAFNIEDMLKTRLTDRFSKLQPVISLGTIAQETRGDGVTLYFPNFPDDLISIEVFNKFYLDLKAKLNPYQLNVNILLSQSSFQETNGAFSIGNLAKLDLAAYPNTNKEKAETAVSNSLYLILLNEPVTQSKKEIRALIDKIAVLHGTERVNFLLRTIPVLQFDQKDWYQFDSDLSYFQHNFGGVGFWPLPVSRFAPAPIPTSASCESSKSIILCLYLNLKSYKDNLEIPTSLDRFVCEHEWMILAIMNLFLIALICLLLAYIKNCDVRAWVRSYLWFVLIAIAIPVLCFLSLLYAQPSTAWRQVSQGNIPVAVMMILFFVGAGMTTYYLKYKFKKPLRVQQFPNRSKYKLPKITWEISKLKGLHIVVKNSGDTKGLVQKVKLYVDQKYYPDFASLFEAILLDFKETKIQEAKIKEEKDKEAKNKEAKNKEAKNKEAKIQASETQKSEAQKSEAQKSEIQKSNIQRMEINKSDFEGIKLEGAFLEADQEIDFLHFKEIDKGEFFKNLLNKENFRMEIYYLTADKDCWRSDGMQISRVTIKDLPKMRY
jgi:hypothetical protein